ncbi:MAG: hypothetical protein NZM12_11405, partial [Steroidobacteraceae bacterium]|nr:hypothetical protein [Steroidobacteraceae bacterium]
TAVVAGTSDPTKVRLEDSARETLQGDPLIGTDTDVPLNFLPRAPNKNITGEVIAVVDGTQLIGQYRIVVLNRGSRHGLALGHVLAIDQRGAEVRDRHGATSVAGLRVGSAFAPKVQLPDERIGSLLVFKVYDRMSYGLTVMVTAPVAIGDRVRTP